MAAEEGRIWYGLMQAALLRGNMSFRLPRDPVFSTAWRGEGKYGGSEEEDEDEDDYSGSDGEEDDDADGFGPGAGEEEKEEADGFDIDVRSVDTGVDTSGTMKPTAKTPVNGPSTPDRSSRPASSRGGSSKPSPADAAAWGADVFRRSSPSSGAMRPLTPLIPRSPEEARTAAMQARTIILQSPAIPQRRAPNTRALPVAPSTVPAALCMLRAAPEAKQVIAWLDRGGDPQSGRPLVSSPTGELSGAIEWRANRIVWADADTARAELRGAFGAIAAVDGIRRLREDAVLSREAVAVLARVAEGAVLLPHLVSASVSGGDIGYLAESRSGSGRLGHASSDDSRPMLGMPGAGPAAAMSAILAKVRGRTAGAMRGSVGSPRPSAWERLADEENGGEGGGNVKGRGRKKRLPGTACELRLSLDHRWLSESRYCGGSPQVVLVAPERSFMGPPMSMAEKQTEDEACLAFEELAKAVVRAWQRKA